MNCFIYSPNEEALNHYSGINTPWTPSDAGLASAVVISLAGASKTAFSFGNKLGNARLEGLVSQH